ncbi:FG-GAP-like repeat-containing protein [Flavobacterium capsici]|uniref:FG-GAP-like repeat-containing protein n=1 Tax=Flavobacterium capsici TaxID=3075618 RepID=A0AA96EXH1_9FLAO|nr:MULTISPECIES: FG-GAP-like repeat-containing protein [unclassified Flavobacterium]WNM18812.1 FG-GAP-like repeat-containing protein [Flavobacterium sp. PMR2A8]WNM22863.1 FG-GAP-like repeat-containing protein [Flavobacterium sp. PMTSA4]
MKKTLSFLVLFFCSSVVFAQLDCANAVSVALNSTTTAPAFTNENGVAPTQLCGLNNGTGSKGKWYKFTATQDINVTITTVLSQNNNKDTRLIVYSGTCAALVCIGSNDDYNGSYGSQVTFAATNGTTYIFAFDNRYSSATFDFSVIEAAPPAQDILSFTSTPVSGIAGNFNNCIVDMNGDYLDDIVSAISTTQLAITYQQSNGTFSTVTFPLTNTVITPSWSIAAGDYDNNGFNDLIYGSGSGVTFLKADNDGTAYTTDRKTQSYLVQRTNFVDINNDGLLDGFACDDNAPNRYYINDGTNLNHIQGGIGDFASGGNYATNWFDFDNDGDVDAYIAKCGQGGSGVGGNIDQLYRNNGNGTFTNIAVEANMANPEQTWSGAVGDFNNDGWMDVIVGVNSLSDGHSNVKRNNGDGTFTSVTAGSGFDTFNSTGREYVAQDFNNDGFLDVLGAGSTIMFGDGNFHFTPNPNTYPLSTVDRPIGDLNNDGFLDIQNGNNILFNNGNSNNWFNVNLRGILSNRNGIGARIEIHGAWGIQIRDVQSGTGFQNMSTLTAHFGIGQETQITQLVIKWPSGTVDTIQNPASNQSLLVVEGSTLSINDFNNTAFNLYPNPAKRILNINSNNGMTFKSITVFDLNGRIVLKSKVDNASVDVQPLTTGTYIALLLDENGKTYSSKFIKE